MYGERLRQLQPRIEARLVIHEKRDEKVELALAKREKVCESLLT